ncbi:MAG TPA: hypothetical protein VK456_03395, partial [Xanthobacteraceae bacterium]|nr:hypothetical protein [Xanthobacteraceae bacterium]
NGAVVGRPVALADRVADRPRDGVDPSRGELRDAPYVEASRERNGRAAVSLRVQPQLVLALREALARAPGIKAAFVYGSAATSAPSGLSLVARPSCVRDKRPPPLTPPPKAAFGRRSSREERRRGASAMADARGEGNREICACPGHKGRQARAAPARDIDLMVIGDGVTYADCFAGLLDAENLLQRRIRAKFVGADEWRRKLKRGSAFVRKLKAQPRIFIFAPADDLQW